MALTDDQTAAADQTTGYQAALALHAVNRTDEALAAYRAVLADDPWHVGALLHAGTLALSLDRSGEAIGLIHALLNQPDADIVASLDLATARIQSVLDFTSLCEGADRMALALAVLEAAQDQRPDDTDIGMALGRLLFADGRQDDSIRQLRRATDLTPENAPAWAMLGAVYLHSGSAQRARPALERALEIDPDNHQARYRLAQALFDDDQPNEALRQYRRLATTVDNDQDVLAEAGKALIGGGDMKNAGIAFGKLLALDPESCLACLGNGVVLVAESRTDEAIEHFQRALGHLPEGASDIVSLARDFALHVPRVVTGALLLAAVDVAWDDTEQLSKAAHIAYGARYGNAAIRGLTRLHELDPDDPRPLPALIDTKLSLCEWGGSETLVQQVLNTVDAAIADGTPLNIDVWNLFAMGVDYPTLARAARYKSTQISADCADTRAACNFTFETPSRPRIRIGYLCPYTWRSSHIANLMTVVRHHDRDRFELFGYAIQEDNQEFDNVFRGLFDAFRHTPLDMLEDSAKRIYDDEIDILIDSTGHFAATCMPLAAMRPAPVIMHGTAGFNIIGAAEFYDYSLHDRGYLTDDLVDLHIEKPFYMPHSAMPAELLAIDTGPTDRAGFDIPEDRFVFADFNHPCKYDPKVFTAWMEILRRVPNGTLMLCRWLDDTANNLHRLAEQQGIAADRVIFAPVQPRSAHLRRLQLCDLALDTYYHCGGVTTVDCLIAGLPILTALPDRQLPLANRSLLAAMGCDDLVMPDLTSYVDRAVELANDPAQLAEIRARMWDNRSRAPLFQAERWVRNLERSLEIIHRNRCDGADPAPFSVLDVEDWPSH